MKTLLLDTKGNVYRIIGDKNTFNGIEYLCAPLTWDSESYDYTEGSLAEWSGVICEADVQCIDTNSFVIRQAKDVLMGITNQRGGSYNGTHYR